MGVERTDATLERRIVLEINGPGVTTDTVDAPLTLELASAFFSLVQANATEAKAPISLRGLKVFDKCAAVAIPFEYPELARPHVEAAKGQLLGERKVAKGLRGLVDRGRTALRRLPEGYEAKILVGQWEASLQMVPANDLPALDSLLSVRATPLRVGGTTPAVRFVSMFEDEPFTLGVTEQQARALGSMLYKSVDIEATVVRDACGAIDGGKLISFEIVRDGDPRPAWKEWFKVVGGNEWTRDIDPENGGPPK